MEVKVHGFAPCDEARVMSELEFQRMDVPGDRLLMENVAPEGQIAEGPEIYGVLAVFVVTTPDPHGSSQLLKRVVFVPPPVQEILNRPYSARFYSQ